MIGKITPLVEEAGRRVWTNAVAFHMLGLGLSSACLGLVLGFAGGILGMPALGVAAPVAWSLVAFVCGLRDVGLVPFPVLEFQRQTPGAWKCVFGAEWAAFLWGLDLGQGWTVRIPFATYFALVIWVILAGHPVVGAATLGAYALGKGLPVAAARWPALRATNGGLVRACLVRRPAAARLVGATTVTVAVLGLASSLTL